MVRTSDFQFENVGSIPSSPILSLYNFNHLKTTKPVNFSRKKIKFTFTFISVIAPLILTNLRFNSLSFSSNKKALLKQSYILLTWFYYLTFLQNNSTNKTRLKFFVAPAKTRKFTLTKAPMAHKNWSKEQYSFGYYIFKISFNSFFYDDNSLISCNRAILFIFLIKNNFSNFETNLFFLKSTQFFFYFHDSQFYNYYKFLVK